MDFHWNSSENRTHFLFFRGVRVDALRSFRSIVWIALLAILPLHSAWSVTLDEMQALFIYKFTNYVTWPESVEKENTSFVMMVEGSASLLAAIEGVVSGRQLQGKTIVVRPWNGQSLGGVRVLVLTSNSESTKNAIKSTRKLPVLIITMKDDWKRWGSVINLILEDEKLRFEIDASLAREKKLEISSQLLKLAKGVY